MAFKSQQNGHSNLPSDEERKLALIPGAEPSTRLDPWWWLVIVVVAALVFLMVFRADFRSIFRFVQDGLRVTVTVTLVSYVVMLFVGMFGGLGRMSKNPLIYGISSLYVEIVRGVPLMVQLIWWYFAFPIIIQGFGKAIHFNPLATYQGDPVLMAILGLVFCYGAYMSEIFRAGIQSIPKGQMEAARSLGMTYFQAMRHIILPQAIRVILPPVGNEFISLLKDSSLVSAVAVADLTRRGREYMAIHFNPIETWSMVALIYLVMTLFSARLVSWLEKRTRVER
jgi:polar amino acid transport system permease protein